MRVTRQTFATHRAALLAEAGKLFRGRGIGGVGVSEIAQAAGLTHGAFYGHFPSKSDLAAEAFTAALTDSAGQWRARAARARAEGRDPLGALIEAYLSERHRDAPETGCALAALGAEVVRDAAMQGALRAGIAALTAVLEEELARLHPGLDPPAIARRALAMLSVMNGGLLTARALASDPDRSRETLRGAAELARQAAER
ncbi:MAG TPA: TetR family transcriptional regulator [Acetobacteraceae bacterium]